MSEKPAPPDNQAAGLPDVDELLAWLNSEPVKQLTEGRVHRITLVGKRRFFGKASLRADGYRRILLNVADCPSLAELTLTLCHELAHYEGKVVSHHDDHWRAAFGELLVEAGELGLLTDSEVAAGLDAALDGPRGAGLDWREKAALREQNKRDHDEAALAPLLAAGLKVGSSVAFTYRGERVVAEVTRINRRTISALSPDGKMRFRLSFSLVELVQ